MSEIHLTPNPVIRKMAESAFGYKGNSFRAIATETAHIEAEGYDNGGTHSDYALLGGEGLTTITQRTPHLGGEVAITPDIILMGRRYFCGKDMGITFYVHPSRMPAFLPADENRQLTREQRIVLVATRSYKSSYAGVSNYRYIEALRETGISLSDWERSKAECQAMGYLTKAGAITVEGRNMVGQTQLYELRHGQG